MHLHKILYFFLFFLSPYIYSQQTVSGILVGESNTPLLGASVLIKKNSDSTTVAYTSTLSGGNFKIEISEGSYIMRISYLGYKNYQSNINITDKAIDLGVIHLVQDTDQLKEVFLKAEANIITKGDTTIYKTDKFLNGTEKKLEDVLLNLPDIGINQDGRVTYKGEVVDRLLIDNENLYKNQHQFATENIASEMVDDIEVIKNYKDFEYIGSNDTTGLTALNIGIKENFKSRLTGAINLGVGIVNKYNANPILFNFRKIIKSSLISNFNNTGEAPLTIKDYNELTNENPIDKDIKGSSIIFLENDNIPQFLLTRDRVKTRTTNFSTLSTIITPVKKIKIDFYGIINHSRQKRENNTRQILTTNNQIINFLENNTLLDENYFTTSKLKAIYKESNNSVFMFDYNLTTDFSNQRDDIENISANQTQIVNSSFTPKNIISKSNLSYSVNKNNSLFKASYYLNTIFDQSQLDIDAVNPLLGLENESENISQSIEKKELLTGVNLIYNKDYNVFNYKLLLNTSYNAEDFFSSNNLAFFNDNSIYLNTYSNKISASIGYKLSKTFSITAGADYNYIYRAQNENSASLLYLDFDGVFKATFGPNNIGTLSYNYLQQTTKLNNLFDNPVITNYRNILLNQDVSLDNLLPYNQLNYKHFINNKKSKSTLVFNANYKFSNNAIGTNVFNGIDVTQTNYKLINKDNIANVLLFYKKDFTSIPFSFTNSITFTFSSMEYFQNDVLSLFENRTIGGFIEFSSNFKKSPVHFSSGYRYTFENYFFGAVTSNVDQQQPYINLKGVINNKLIWELDSFYNIFEVDGLDRNIFYINPEIQYSKKSSDWSYSIIGNNILNLNNSTIVENSTVVGSVQQRVTSILQGNLLFNVKYKF